MSLLLRPQAVAWQTTFISLIALILIIFAPYATPQNVTLTSFTATSLLGQPEIYVEWKTAAEFDTVVFLWRAATLRRDRTSASALSFHMRVIQSPAHSMTGSMR